MSTHVHRYTESREDRNKRIAIEAITLAERVAKVLERSRQGVQCAEDVAAELEAFHTRWKARGVNWTRPSLLPLEPDEWYTANELAAHLDKDPATIRRWHYRGHISALTSPDGTPRYQWGEVVAYDAARRARASGALRQGATCTPTSDVS